MPSFQCRLAIFTALLPTFWLGCAPDAPARPEPTPEPIADIVLPGTSTVEVLEPIVLTPDAFLPEQDPSFVAVEVLESTLVFHFEGGGSPLAVGQIVSGIEGEGYLRRIVALEDDGAGNVIATTEPAEIVDLIHSGRFRAQLVPADTTIVPDEEGLATEGLTTDWQLFPPGRTLPCTVSGGGRASRSAGMSATLDLDVEMHIERCSLRRGCMLYAHFIASGSLRAYTEVTTAGSVNVNCMNDVAESAMPRLRHTFTFQAGVIPVRVTQEIRPSATLRLLIQGFGSDTTSRSEGTVSLRAGARYTDGAWDYIWEPRSDGTTTVTTTGCGSLEGQAQLRVGARYALRFYDVAGPTITYGPQVTADFGRTTSPPAWESSLRVGLGGRIAGSVEVRYRGFDVKLAEVWSEIPEIELFRRDFGGATRLSCGGDAGPVPPRPTDAGFCQERGTGCIVDEDCCGGSSDARIQCIAGRCDDIRLCQLHDETCTSGSGSSPCCGGLQCTTQSSSPTALSCCVSAGGVCRSQEDCCGAMFCNAGRCEARRTGDACFSSFECGGSDVCTSGRCGRR